MFWGADAPSEYIIITPANYSFVIIITPCHGTIILLRTCSLGINKIRKIRYLHDFLTFGHNETLGDPIYVNSTRRCSHDVISHKETMGVPKWTLCRNDGRAFRTPTGLTKRLESSQDPLCTITRGGIGDYATSPGAHGDHNDTLGCLMGSYIT